MVFGPDVPGSSVLYVINCIASVLSFTGSSLMAYFCYKAPPPRHVSLKFVLAIAIADFFYSVANIMSAFEDVKNMTPLCHIEGVIRVSSFMMTLYFTTCLAIICCRTSNLGKTRNQETFFRRSLILGAIIGLLFVFSPLLFPKYLTYNNGSLYCELSSPKDAHFDLEMIVLVITEGGPIVIAIIVTLASYYITIKRLKRLPKDILKSMNVRTSRLFTYPIVLFLTFVPCIAYSFTIKIVNSEGILALQCVHLMMTHSIGLTNAIIYGVHKKIDTSSSSDSLAEPEDSYSRFSIPSEYSQNDHELRKNSQYYHE